MANFFEAPMPGIGPPTRDLWQEFAAQKIDLSAHLPSEAVEMVQR